MMARVNVAIAVLMVAPDALVSVTVKFSESSLTRSLTTGMTASANVVFGANVTVPVVAM